MRFLLAQAAGGTALAVRAGGSGVLCKKAESSGGRSSTTGGGRGKKREPDRLVLVCPICGQSSQNRRCSGLVVFS